jgi:uncharacterized protein YnzC (UPF0291/DUF896 family)
LKSKKYLLISIVLASAIFFPVSGLAQSSEASKQVHPKHEHHHHHAADAEHFRVYHEHYIKLLVEKYTPEDGAKWAEALKTKSELMEQFHELKKSAKKPHSFLTDEEKKAHKALHQQFMEAVKTEDDKQIKALLPKLLIEQEQMNAKFKAKWSKLNEGSK